MRPGTERPAGAAAGQVGRRRPLPSGRALAGAFFIAVAAVAVVAVLVSATATHGRRWVVAGVDLPVGARLRAGDLTTESLTLPAAGVGSVAFDSPASLVGRVLAAPLRAGELVQSGDLAAISSAPALRPVTVAVASSDLADLSLGSLVDVLVTDGTDPSSPTLVVASGARVLAVDRSSGGLVPGATGAEVTLGVGSLATVTTVVHAAHTGSLSVVVGAPGDRVTPAPAATGTSSGTAPAAAAGAGG